MTATREIRLHLEAGLHFVARTPTGHDVHLDSHLEDGGEGAAGPTPMEMQLVTLGACTGMDVISILRKMRQDVASYDVRLSGDRAEGHPRAYTSIAITHAFRGTALSRTNVHRAIQLSMARYCPVFAMLYPKVAISGRFEIMDDATREAVSGGVSIDGATT